MAVEDKFLEKLMVQILTGVSVIALRSIPAFVRFGFVCFLPKDAPSVAPQSPQTAPL
jgi:hypothetical protein